MTHRRLGDAEMTRRWARRCTELAPEDPQYACAWTWLVQSVLVSEGVEAAEEVLAEALANHPTFGELHYLRMMLGAFRWMGSFESPGEYGSLPQGSSKYLHNLAAASSLLGFPFSFSREQGRA
jgi:hypothetical protein